MKKKKRIMIVLAVLTTLFLSRCYFSHQLSTESKINTVYQFPITPDMDEWRELDTFEKMLDATQIPEEILKEMTDEDLVETVLNYPLLSNLILYNSYQEGYEMLKYQFNGLEYLANRNVASILLERYKVLVFREKMANLKDSEFLSGLLLLILLEQDDFRNQLNDEEIRELEALQSISKLS